MGPGCPPGAVFCLFSKICFSLVSSSSSSLSCSSCPPLSYLLSSALSPPFFSTFSLSLLSPLSLLFFSCHPGRSQGGELPGGPGGSPRPGWGSGAMVHVLLCTDRQAQDRSFRQSRPHNPSLKHRNRQGNHWHTRHGKGERQRGTDQHILSHFSQDGSPWRNTSGHNTRHTQSPETAHARSHPPSPCPHVTRTAGPLAQG